MIFPIFLSYSAHAAYVATLTLGLLLEKRIGLITSERAALSSHVLRLNRAQKERFVSVTSGSKKEH
jgi:hypothetical protein